MGHSGILGSPGPCGGCLLSLSFHGLTVRYQALLWARGPIMNKSQATTPRNPPLQALRGEKERGMACLCPSHVVAHQILGEWEPVQGEKSSEKGKWMTSDPGAEATDCSQVTSGVDKD